MGEVRRRVSKKIAKFCNVMADRTKKHTPIVTGNNRDSINFTVDGLKGQVFTESGYGGWLEVGTYKMHPRPYFQPAFSEARSVLDERMDVK